MTGITKPFYYFETDMVFKLHCYLETLQKMEAHLQRREVEETANVERLMEGDIWLGDFNRHHPMWDSAKNSRLFTRAALMEAQELISILADYDMTMALPEGIPTI